VEEEGNEDGKFVKIWMEEGSAETAEEKERVAAGPDEQLRS